MFFSAVQGAAAIAGGVMAGVASGASTRELMHRIGPGSMHAASIYQHATGERDREIVDALQFRIERELKDMGPSRAQGSR